MSKRSNACICTDYSFTCATKLLWRGCAQPIWFKLWLSTIAFSFKTLFITKCKSFLLLLSWILGRMRSDRLKDFLNSHAKEHPRLILTNNFITLTDVEKRRTWKIFTRVQRVILIWVQSKLRPYDLKGGDAMFLLRMRYRQQKFTRLQTELVWNSITEVKIQC